MIDLLVTESSSRYDVLAPPGDNNSGGGMGVKYARVCEVLSRQHAVRRVYRLEDIQSDFVIADATWFVWDNPQDINNAVQSFVECGFPRVLLYGSEHSFMSFPSLLRDALTDACTWVTHNCKYQRNLYRMCGIYDSVYLCDPVPEDILPWA